VNLPEGSKKSVGEFYPARLGWGTDALWTYRKSGNFARAGGSDQVWRDADASVCVWEKGEFREITGARRA